MKKTWSASWISSSQPRKQRKYRRNAPLHQKKKYLGCHLSAELRTKHGTRSIRVRTGDKVKVLRGQFKGQTGKVERVDTKKGVVFITKVEQLKKDGTKSMQPLRPNSIMIIELNVSDKRRMKKGAIKSGQTTSQKA